MLASRSVTALALRWFGGDSQPAVPREIPLETFTEAIDMLAGECERIVLMGLSYGAEAALLTASTTTTPGEASGHTRACPLPSCPSTGRGSRRRPCPRSSSSTSTVGNWLAAKPSKGQPFPSRSSEEDWFSSRAVTARYGRAARPPGTSPLAVLDRVLRRSSIEDPKAGHPIVLPGETPPNMSRPYQVGGGEDAPQRLGALAWPAIRRVLQLDGDV